jgi:hypothetical protein
MGSYIGQAHQLQFNIWMRHILIAKLVCIPQFLWFHNTKPVNNIYIMLLINEPIVIKSKLKSFWLGLCSDSDALDTWL